MVKHLNMSLLITRAINMTFRVFPDCIRRNMYQGTPVIGRRSSQTIVLVEGSNATSTNEYVCNSPRLQENTSLNPETTQRCLFVKLKYNLLLWSPTNCSAPPPHTSLQNVHLLHRCNHNRLLLFVQQYSLLMLKTIQSNYVHLFKRILFSPVCLVHMNCY